MSSRELPCLAVKLQSSKAWFLRATQAQAEAEERLFHLENGVDASISTSFFLCLHLSLRLLASCENETRHKHKEISSWISS